MIGRPFHVSRCFFDVFYFLICSRFFILISEMRQPRDAMKVIN